MSEICYNHFMDNAQKSKILGNAKYRVALQPTKQTEIWIKLCKTICGLYKYEKEKKWKILDRRKMI